MSITSQKANSIVPANNNAQNQVQFDELKAIVQNLSVLDGEGDINLTPIAKIFGKVIYEWQRKKTTKDILQEIEQNTATEKSGSGILRQKVGGTGEQGTFTNNPDVFLEFLRYCSPKLAVAMTRIVRELFEKGKVELNPVAPSQPTNQFDFLRGLLDSLENQSLRISTVENKLEKVIEIKQNILDIVGEAPEKTARISLRQLVENYCEKHQDEPFIYQTTWGILYREVKDRLHADVKARAKEYNKNLKKEGGKKKDEKRAIDFIEELGLEKPTIAIFLEITAEKFE